MTFSQQKYMMSRPEVHAIMEYIRNHPGCTVKQMRSEGIQVDQPLVNSMHRTGLIRKVGNEGSKYKWDLC